MVLIPPSTCRTLIVSTTSPTPDWRGFGLPTKHSRGIQPVPNSSPVFAPRSAAWLFSFWNPSFRVAHQILIGPSNLRPSHHAG